MQSFSSDYLYAQNIQNELDARILSFHFIMSKSL